MLDTRIAPSIPSHSPSYFRGPFVFYKREYFIIAFRTTPEAIAKALPAPIQPVGDNIILYEFMAMPDAPGLGSYNESGILIPGVFEGRQVNYTAQMYLDCEPAIYAGREIWGFPKKRGNPSLFASEDCLVGELRIGEQLVALGTMPYKAEPILSKHDPTPEAYEVVRKKLTKPQVNLKIIPNVDGTDGVRRLVEYTSQVIAIHEAWRGPARLHLVPHADAAVADFPILEVIDATHMIADIILPYGRVAYDYLKRDSPVTAAVTVPSIPMHAPSYTTAQHHFYNREHFVVKCKTTPEAIRNALPPPLEPCVTDAEVVEFSFMLMKDSPGFGSYSETSVRIPCLFKGERCSFVHQVYSDSSASQYGGRELWGLPMKRGATKVFANEDTLVASLRYGAHEVAFATMPYKAEAVMAKHEHDAEKEKALIESMSVKRVSLKLIPAVDGSIAQRQLVSYVPLVQRVHEAWRGPARLHLVPHVNAPLADFPIQAVLGAVHFVCDMALPLGEIIHNYEVEPATTA